MSIARQQIDLYYDELRSAHPRIAWPNSERLLLRSGISPRLQLPINDRRRPDGYEYWPVA